MFRLPAALLALLCTPADARAPEPAALTPAIAIEAPPEGEWTVRYRFAKPVRRLVFQRSPDSSRVGGWKPAPGFEIVRLGDSELMRRKDGRPFRRASATMLPVYRELPKDYAPFSRFGDGGILVYSGRFFACAVECEDGARWPMSLTVADGRRILIDGRMHDKSARWVDENSGRNVYVGDAEPIEGPDLIAVIDTALPPKIRGQLEEQLPRFMGYFAAQLGQLPAKPTLFASYDVAHTPGHGRQGGTLTGQVFTHFYGDVWPKRMEEPTLAYDLAWFFAHEAGHLYQRQLHDPEKTGAWIHEGGADAFAAIALEATDPALEEPLKQLLAAKRRKCTSHLGTGSVHDALAAGRFDAAYDCGLIVNLALHKALLARSPGGGGLFQVWRDYIAAAQAGAQPGEALFLAALERSGGAALAARVKAAVRAPGPQLLDLS